MPPKKAIFDWSWVGTDVKNPQQITKYHCHRAAGLVDVQPCNFNTRPRSPSRSNTVESDASIIPLEPTPTSSKEPACGKKKCKGNVRCYNHLGAEKVFKPDKFRDEVIQERTGPEIELREDGAGLRNFGATCYANAFLQVWYHNIAFRNGVYACLTSEKSPLHYLALIFASLQHTIKRVVDPGNLVDALRLEKENQQDAAEFSKLFMSLLASEFRKQTDPKLRSLITDQFEGTVKYITQCSQCAYTSERSSTFLELEINLKDGSTLNDRLAAFTQAESLDGNNKYFCPQCDALRPATRRTELETLPPVLHFSLMRFVFDPATMRRKKSKAKIEYPETLQLKSEKYELRGVVIHHGASAHHGHFSCEVYDEDDQEWYHCNDEEVSKMSNPPKKKTKVEDDTGSTPNPTRSSKDAYMLVYKKEGKVEAITAPASVMAKVEADNVATQDEIAKREQKSKEAEEEFEKLQEAKLAVLAVLPGTDHIIPRDGLSEWLLSKNLEDLQKPFDYTPTQCTHNGIGPYKTPESRLISSAAFQLLGSQVQDLDICQICIEEEFTTRIASLERVNHVKLFDELDQDDEGDGYMLPKKWLKQWRNDDLPLGCLPTDEEYSIVCEHDAPWHISLKATKVSPAAFTLLQSLLPDLRAHESTTPQCEICQRDNAVDVESFTEWQECKTLHKSVVKQLNVFQVFGVDNYVIPPVFWERYTQYMADVNVEKPLLKEEVCEHGLIDYDPRHDIVSFITSAGWDMLRGRYCIPESEVVVKFAAKMQSGYRYPIETVSRETCVECRTKRLLDFEETSISILIGGEDPSGVETKQTLNGRTRSTNPKKLSMKVTKLTKALDIKVFLYGKTKVSPICQKLFFGKALLEGEDTVGSMSIPADGVLRMEEVIEEGDVDDGRVDEGFGGTALVARTGCPDCTFENDAQAAMCEMCNRPFNV